MWKSLSIWPMRGIRLLRSASCTLIVMGCPSRLSPKVTYASRRSFADHAVQLRLAFDGRPVHGENDVVLLDAGFARGSVLIHHGHFHTLFFLQLQSAQAVGSDIHNVHAKVGAGA